MFKVSEHLGRGLKRGGFGYNQEVLTMFICLQSLGILELFEVIPETWRTVARVIKLVRTSENNKRREDLVIIDLEAFRSMETLRNGKLWGDVVTKTTVMERKSVLKLWEN